MYVSMLDVFKYIYMFALCNLFGLSFNAGLSVGCVRLLVATSRMHSAMHLLPVDFVLSLVSPARISKRWAWRIIIASCDIVCNEVDAVDPLVCFQNVSPQIVRDHIFHDISCIHIR